MKTILITGGAGFIGSTFTHYIYNNYPNYKIIVVDSLNYAGSIENLPVKIWKNDYSEERFSFWYGNVMNGELMDTLVSQANCIVHFAAESHVTRSIYDNTQFFQTDVIGTQTIANAVCKYSDRIDRFIHISTSEVYGSAEADTMDEEHSLNPMSPYAAAKAGADRLVYSYWKTYGIPAVIIRPFNNFGPRQHLEKVIPRFITSVILNEQLRVHGDGSSSRDFVHVTDNCRAIDLVLHAQKDKVIGEVFNVGSGTHRTILSIAQDVTRLMGANRKNLIHIGDRPGQVMRHTANTKKIKTVLGWNPEIEWEKGLIDSIKWYTKNRQWWEKQLWLRDIPIISAAGTKELH